MLVKTLVLSPREEKFERARQTIGLFMGPLLFLAVLLVPMPSLSPQAHKLAAVLVLVLAYWIGEPIPLPVTALLGPVLCVVLGIDEPKAVFAPFAHPIIFLFLGSFMLAQAMIAHRLNERIALLILSIPWLSRRSWRLLLGIGLIPLGISMWISDSATTAMIYPILLGIFTAFRSSKESGFNERFEIGLLLTISYSALIGGIGTPVGTPPNLIGIGMLDKLAGTRILFFQWMLLSIPIMLVMAAALFAVMILRFPSKQRYDQSTSKYVGESRRQAGPWTRGQKNALVCFIAAVFLWVFPGIVASALGAQSALYKFCEQHIPEGVASLVAAILLFLLPTDWKKREFTLNWKQALRIDWGTILLFGGGLSLGNLMFSTKLADVVGQKVLLLSGVTSLWGLTGVFIALAIALTEVTSNTATASMLVPIAIALSKSLAVSPVPPAVGVCLGASMAFMMPVSTPSNAIIYGSGKVPMTSMITTGVILDLISFSVIFTGLRLLCPVLGLM